MNPLPTKSPRGRRAADPERDLLLDHFAAWLALPAGKGRTNADRVNSLGLCQAAGVDPQDWNKWRHPTSRHKLTKDQYLRLCPWLATWYGYVPPTNEYQFL